MSARTVSLSPQEALARDLIVQRVSARRHAPRTNTPRRHTRAALLLRRLAERLDPPVERPAQRPARAQGQPLLHVPEPRLTPARPWSAAPRRAPHRHT